MLRFPRRTCLPRRHRAIWGRLLLLVPAVCALYTAAIAQGIDQRPGYAVAEAAFYRLSPPERYRAQMLLIAAGHWNAVSNEQFSKRLFDAINSYKAAGGLDQTGILDEADLARLRHLAAPALRTWRLRALPHPRYPATLWVPAGLGLALAESDKGYQIEDRAKSIRIYFYFLAGADLASAFRESRSLRVSSGFKIDYEALRSDFFVLAASKPEAVTYIRYHAVAGGLIGFAIFVDANRTDVLTDRLITLMSDLFRAEVQLGDARRPPDPPEGERLVAWQEPSAGFGQGAIGSVPTIPSPAPRPPDPLPSPPPGVVVTLPSSETPRPAERRDAALPPKPEPSKPAPPPPWRADGRVVELLTQLHYLQPDDPPPSRERLAEVVREFGRDRKLTSPPADDALLAALRGAAQSEASLPSCRAADAERGAICLR